MSAELQIVFEDAHCLAVVKPAGQLTQGDWAPPGETTLEQDVRRRLRPEAPESAYVGIVHRLDRPVSGILLWAKDRKSARRLAMQFEKRQAIKEYWAVVDGAGACAGPAAGPPTAIFPAVEEVWEDWLVRADSAGVVRSVAEGAPGARRGVTRVLRDEAEGLPEGAVWLRLWPETGRTHQLRVQAAARGMPILGDVLYGSSRPFAPGVALHARSLQVRHPALATPLVLTAPPPRSWAEQGVMLPGPRPSPR